MKTNAIMPREVQKIEIIPAIAEMFAIEQRQSKHIWFTGKIEIIPAIADIFEKRLK